MFLIFSLYLCNLCCSWIRWSLNGRRVSLLLSYDLIYYLLLHASHVLSPHVTVSISLFVSLSLLFSLSFCLSFSAFMSLSFYLSIFLSIFLSFSLSLSLPLTLNLFLSPPFSPCILSLQVREHMQRLHEEKNELLVADWDPHSQPGTTE